MSARRSNLQPIQQARVWWKAQVDGGRYVVSPAEVASAAIARVLRQEGLVMDVAGKRAWILTPAPPIDRRAIFIANYWPVVALVLARYAPVAVAGVNAIRLYMDDYSIPEVLPVYQGANQSEYALLLEPGFALRLRPRTMPTQDRTLIMMSGNVQIPVLSVADTLTTLDQREIAANVEIIAAWLRHLVVRTPNLATAVQDNPRPVVLQRLADLAGAIGNKPLAKQLDAAARKISPHATPPARTGIGSRITVPVVLQATKRAMGTPWLDEQAMRLARQAADIEKIVGARSAKFQVFPWRLLRANAERVRAYDAYHSTTMEGYKISREVSDAIIRGEPLADGPQSRAALEAAMAIQGYSIAFDEVLARAQKKMPVTIDLVLDLYEALFRPSVDMGITDSAALRGWRNASVGLRGWLHVPPNPKKVPDLMSGLERYLASANLTPITQALLVHLELVTIHPFVDGNGRLGRLLMNYVLLSAGLPWVTVRSDERIPFFKSIEQAQIKNDVSVFVRFMWHVIEQSVQEVRIGASRKPIQKNVKRKPK